MIDVSNATDGDWRAARILLPDAVHYGCRCQVGVARDEQQRVIGAAALAPDVRRRPVPGRRIMLHVIEPWRRRGVGRRLVHWAQMLVINGDLRALYAWHSVDPASADAAAWKGLGFSESVEHPLSRIEAQHGYHRLAPLLKRRFVRRPPPPDAQIIPLRNADPEKVIALQTQHIGGTRAELISRLSCDLPSSFHPELSRVLLIGDQVAGLILVTRIAPQICYVDSNVLDPSVRAGGWANLWLKHDLGRVALEAGVREFHFDTLAEHRDTRRFAEKLGVTHRRVDLFRVIPVAGADA